MTAHIYSPCFCSWSGGKDSCLALYRAIQKGFSPKFLLTTSVEKNYSCFHNLSIDTLQWQAKSLGIPLVLCETSWPDYQMAYIQNVIEAQQNISTVSAGIFGDIDIEEHREWVEKVCSKLQCEPVLPLWKGERSALMTEFLNLGFKATITVIDSNHLDLHYLGRILDMELFKELVDKKIDPYGENGEFHTIVTDGPLFAFPLPIQQRGEPRQYLNYWIQDFCVSGNEISAMEPSFSN